MMLIAKEETDSADVRRMSGPCLWRWYMGSNTEGSTSGWDFKGHMVLGPSQGTDWQFVSPWLNPLLIDVGRSLSPRTDSLPYPIHFYDIRLHYCRNIGRHTEI